MNAQNAEGGLGELVRVGGARRGVLGDDDLGEVRLKCGEDAGGVLIRENGEHTDEAGEVEIAVQRCA